MKASANGICPAKSDETNMDELNQEELQVVAGGGVFGDVWDGIKTGADDVGSAASSAYNWTKSEAEAHPDIAKGIAIAGSMAVGVAAGGAIAEAISAGAEADAEKAGFLRAAKRVADVLRDDPDYD
ncbi:hypothetical protein [Martelella mediterranea]|nr:hypothetical protein [Martelella mediterranea]